MRRKIQILGMVLFLSGALSGFGLAAIGISKDVPIGTIPASSELGSSKESRMEALAKFVKANFEYKDGRYAQAIKFYEEIIDGGLATGAVYYNLGNSYFQEGALGKAILNYERARTLMPRDHDLRANYQYALSLTSQPAGRTMSWGAEAYNRFIEFYTLDELVMTSFILIILAGTIYLVSLYLSWPGSLKSRMLIPLLVLFFVYFTGAFSKGAQQKGAGVVVTSLPATFEPREAAAKHFDLAEGSQIKILKIDGIWAKIKRLDGKEGWVPASAIGKI